MLTTSFNLVIVWLAFPGIDDQGPLDTIVFIEGITLLNLQYLYSAVGFLSYFDCYILRAKLPTNAYPALLLFYQMGLQLYQGDKKLHVTGYQVESIEESKSNSKLKDWERQRCEIIYSDFLNMTVFF